MSNASAAEATASKPLGRPPKQRQQRQRILNEAAKIIARVGYEECSLSRIAEGLDLSPPAIYHYFPTKQSIFSEIAMTTVKGIHEHGCDAIDVNQSFTRQLEQMMVAHAKYFDEHYWMVNATIAGYGGIARREIEQLTEFEAYRHRYEKLLLRILRGGINAEEFRCVDVKPVARAIFQLLNITRWYRPDGAKKAVDFALESYELIIRSLMATEI